MYQKIIVLK